jgi:tetratricopeptide (TPR) repeat protein
MALIEQGRAALAAGQTDKAGAYFREATVVSPQNPQIPLMAAAAALRQNHPEVAITVLVPAAERFHESAAIYRALGLAHYRLGDYESSQVALRQALSLDKSSAPSYFLMGCVLAKLGQREAAEAHLRQAQALDPRCAVRR